MNTNSLQLSSASQQHLFFGNGSPFQFGGDMTVEVWFKPEGSQNGTLLAKDNDGQGGVANRDWRVYLLGNRYPQFIQWNSSQQGILVQTGNPVATDQWSHFAATFNSSTRAIRVYLNGQLNNTATWGSSTRNVSNAYVRAGVRGYSTLLDFYNGLLDEIRLWNIVRSDDDIANNYLRELAGNESGLVLYCKLNGNYNDYSPNGLNASPSGTPTFSTDVPFLDNTTTSTSTTTTTTSTSTTTTSTSSSTSTTSSTSTSTTTTSTSTTTTSTTTTQTSTTTTSTSTTTTSTSTTTTSSSTSTTTSTSTSTTITVDLRFMVERVI